MLRWLVRLAGWLGEQGPSDSTAKILPLDSAAADDGESKPFIEHLEDLRRTLFKIGAALFIGFNVCMVFANRILFFLEAPLSKVVPDSGNYLQSLNVTDSFVLWMKLAFYGGILLATPAIFYFLSDFILPALKREEKRLLMPTFLFGAFMFVAGAAACYYLMIPQTLRVFIKYSEWLKIKPQWTVTSYISFVTQFMLSMGVTLEIPLVILLLVQLGVISARTVARGRKLMITGAVILAAILAPPDPLSMLMMSMPLIAICEVTIWLSWLVEYRRRKRTT